MSTARRTVLGVAVIVAIAVGSIGLRSCGPSSDGTTTYATTSVAPQDSVGTAASAGPRTIIDGVPHGWSHNPRGATAAALAAVALSGHVATSGFITRTDVIASIATARFGQSLALETTGQIADLTDHLSSDGVGPKDLVWWEMPMRTRVQAFTTDRAVVDVWSVLVIGVRGSSAARQAWRTVSVTLAWESGDWLIDGWNSESGPTPALTETAEVSTLDQLIAVVSWPQIDGGGA